MDTNPTYRSMEEQEQKQKEIITAQQELYEAKVMDHGFKTRKMNQFNQKIDQLGKTIDANRTLLFDPVQKNAANAFHKPTQKEKKIFGREPSILDKDKTKQAQKEEKRYQKEKEKGLKKIKAMTKKIEHMTEKVVKHSDLDYDHRETLERMRGSILLANEVDVAARTDMMNRLDTIADQMAKVHKRFTRARLAVALCNRQNQTGLEVFTKRLDEAFVEKEALERQLEEVKAQYNQVINFVAGKDAYARVLSRRKACQKARKCSREEANHIILKRTQVPATLEHIDEVQEAYLTKKTGKRITSPIEDYDYYQELPYDSQMKWVMNQLHTIPAYRTYTQEKVEQYTKQYLKKLVEQSSYMFRCSAKNFNLIANDKMKTQMEVGSSGGMMNTNYRKAFSEQTFGVKSKQLDNTEFENYGYLGSTDNFLQVDSPTRQYGNIAVRLNKERMKNRVTCTFGDSLDNQATARAQRIENAGMGCVGLKGKLELAQYAISAATSRMNLKPMESDMLAKQLDLGYLELQYHGDVTARDMDEVVAVRPTYRFRADISQESKDKALQELDEEFTKEMSSAFLKVQDINEHPEHYGRTGMPPLSFLVVDGDKVKKLI